MKRERRDRSGQEGRTELGARLAPSLGANVTWKKSSWSAHNGSCVEVASLPASEFGVRDSKDKQGPALVFVRNAWTSFLAEVKNGQFDVE